MPNSNSLENDIKKIGDTFHFLDISGSTEQILKTLAEFERGVAGYMDNPFLAAVTKWYKNLILQKTNYLPRAEELLDEALETLETTDDPVFDRWKLKIYLSLGYVHLAQKNYLDAEFYLNQALNMTLTHPSQAKFSGEVYSLLGTANLALNRFSRARKYIALDKEDSYSRYLKNADDTSSMIYAYSLVNFSRINRLMDLKEQAVGRWLDEAVDIFSKLNYTKGLLKARLEQAEWRVVSNLLEEALADALELEQKFSEEGMHLDRLSAGLLAAKIHKTMHEYDQAEKKIHAIIRVARERGQDQDQIMADILYEMGAMYYATNRETEAFEYLRQSAKVGMILGINSVIIRAFNTARVIDKYLSAELLTSDLVYNDSMFIRNRLGRSINPFTAAKNRAKIFASTIFVDIVGFSGLMKRSDEDMTVKMIDELIDRLCLIIYQHDGYIDKFLGDGFMAIFEHGNQPVPAVALNAIKAGVDIHRALIHKNRKLRQVYGVDTDIQVRMGVSTGEIYAIILGNYIKREFTYLGNSVNLAAKLESQATDQLMLVDTPTYDLIQDNVVAEQEVITVRGLGQINVYQVSRLTRLENRH
ncbi:MAG: hypothetical protein HQK60_00470 [Deltaproteobacteria bacterium]|nr:hypothetical protein [Deltaproteobacteria bacterium]